MIRATKQIPGGRPEAERLLDATHKVVAEGREAIKDVQRAEEFNSKVETVLSILDGLQEPPKPKKVSIIHAVNKSKADFHLIFSTGPARARSECSRGDDVG